MSKREALRYRRWTVLLLIWLPGALVVAGLLGSWGSADSAAVIVTQGLLVLSSPLALLGLGLLVRRVVRHANLREEEWQEVLSTNLLLGVFRWPVIIFNVTQEAVE